MKIEAKGSVGKCDMPKVQETLRTLNGQLDEAKRNKSLIEKQLKSTEVGDRPRVNRNAGFGNYRGFIVPLVTFQGEFRRITKEVEKNAAELETLHRRVEELNVCNEGGSELNICVLARREAAVYTN